MEYRRILANAGVRFSARPFILSPQLEDFDDSEVLRRPVPRVGADFRVVLSVEGFELDQVTITVEAKDLLQVRMTQTQPKRHKSFQKTNFPEARDCCYRYQIPKEVHPSRLLAQWTADEFLVIQARSSPALTPGEVERIVPVRVGRVMQPFLDVKVLKEMMVALQHEMNKMRSFVDQNSKIKVEEDVLQMKGRYPSVEFHKLKNEMSQYISALESELMEKQKETFAKVDAAKK